MNSGLLHGLLRCETDLDGALKRFSGDEAFYLMCLNGFLQDDTISTLDRAIVSQSWDDAFTAAHALKGLAGNMGFIPLFHATGELVLLIRTGRIGEIDASLAQVKRCYDEIITVIQKNNTVAG